MFNDYFKINVKQSYQNPGQKSKFVSFREVQKRE